MAKINECTIYTSDSCYEYCSMYFNISTNTLVCVPDSLYVDWFKGIDEKDYVKVFDDICTPSVDLLGIKRNEVLNDDAL